MTDALGRGVQRLGALEKQLQSVDYRRTLARGYSVTRRVSTGKLISAAAAAKSGDVIETEVFDGSFESTVNDPLGREVQPFE